MSLRTDAVELDQDFEYTGEVIKSYVDEATGKRYIVGAASGLEEDQDGERVSKRAIAAMVNAIGQGGVKVVAGSHEQNWLTECGDAVEAHVDPKTDQLIVKTELAPEGQDPIADKAWRETHSRKMGWSIGGKLRAAYHELTDTGKKRKVLDSIDLRHLCLTDKPAYQHSFAHAVAKTWDADAPVDDEFVAEDVAKDVTGSWVPGGGGNSGEDSKTGGKRNAGEKKPGSKGMSVDDDGQEEPEEDDTEDQVEPTDRHLSCPQCGHEFAADIPVDMTPEERSDQDKRKEALEDAVPGDGSGKPAGEGEEQAASDGDQAPEDELQGKDNPDDKDDEDGKKKKPAEKSQEVTMDIEKRLELLEARVADAGVGTVAKTEPEDTPAEGITADVLKVVALATQDDHDAIEKTRSDLAEGFELLGKAVMEMRETIAELPMGRKSTARVLKSHLEPEDEESVEERIEKSESPVEALKILNEATYGIS